jgi:hypothetical protein
MKLLDIVTKAVNDVILKNSFIYIIDNMFRVVQISCRDMNKTAPEINFNLTKIEENGL